MLMSAGTLAVSLVVLCTAHSIGNQLVLVMWYLRYICYVFILLVIVTYFHNSSLVCFNSLTYIGFTLQYYYRLILRITD